MSVLLSAGFIHACKTKCANLAQAYVSNKYGEDLVRQDGSPSRNLQSIIAEFDQTGIAQTFDLVMIAFHGVHTEAPQVLIQIYAVFQPQSQKQVLTLTMIVIEFDTLDNRR